LGRAQGVTDEQLRDLSRYGSSNAFTPREKLVLDLAVAMTTTPPDVSDELFGELQQQFTSAQLVELATEVGLANLRGRFNTTFRCRVAGYSGDAYCPLPDRTNQ
jgi:alkylhydroperoxidase family enzyme